MTVPSKPGKDDVINGGVNVIGASIAGLFAAREMARAGLRVRVWEAQGSLKPRPRTLIVTSAWLRLLDFDAEPAVLNHIHAVELVSRRASVRIPLREPDLVVERFRFLDLLAAEAERAGAELVLDRRLRTVSTNGQGCCLHFFSDDAKTPCGTSRVLGADGLRSAVARAVGRESLRHVAILQARVPLPSDLAEDTVRIWFDRQSTRFFYWLIPESSWEGVAGLIAEAPADAERALARFLAAQGLTPTAYQAAEVPVQPRVRRPHSGKLNGRVLLTGDAAGQVKVTTVGGVVTGMRGARAAARSLVRGSSYARELQPLRRELTAHAMVRHVLDRFRDEDYDALLRLLNRQGVRALGTVTRDEMPRVFWRLILAQPRWFMLGARALTYSARRWP
jgi:digeranylgeranylglycerophospholipid reductase